jgi:hypothetical protein
MQQAQLILSSDRLWSIGIDGYTVVQHLQPPGLDIVRAWVLSQTAVIVVIVCFALASIIATQYHHILLCRLILSY